MRGTAVANLQQFLDDVDNTVAVTSYFGRPPRAAVMRCAPDP
jgi:hypothetical protein